MNYFVQWVDRSSGRRVEVEELFGEDLEAAQARFDVVRGEDPSRGVWVEQREAA